MTHILRFHTEIGKMPVVLDPCPWPRLAYPWPWPRLVWPWLRKNFEVLVLGLDLKVLGLNTTLVVAILVRFEQFFGNFWLNFLPLNLNVSPHMMHFVHTFSIMRAQGVRLMVIKKIQNYIKTLPSKNRFENGW